MKEKKSVLITGANGYIGKHVVEKALRKGLRVIASDIYLEGVDERAEKTDFPIFSGDPDIYEKLGKPDILIHMAWQDGFQHNAPSHMMNLSKHYEFLTNMAAGGCKNIAVMGTMHEVGYWEGKIDADTPCSPLSMYGIAKNALRQAMLLKAKELGFNLYWLRAFYIMGDDTRNHSIYTKILQAASEGKKEFPFTSGKNKYDFIDVDDLAQMIVDASAQETYKGIINVCTGTAVSLGEKVEQFIQDRKLDIRLKYGAFPDRAYDSPIVYGDNTVISKIQSQV